MSCKFSMAMVVNQVTTCGDVNVVGVYFLWAIVNNNASIGDSLVSGYIVDFVVSHDKEIVAPLCSSFLVTLC